MGDFLAEEATKENGGSIELYSQGATGTALPPAVHTADLMFQSGLFPSARNTAGVFTIIQFGKEVGLSPVVALNNVAVISGKLSMSGASMLALACKHGVKATIVKEEKDGAIVDFEREGFPPYRSEFTEQDAIDAGLLERDKDGKIKSDVWRKYTKIMLRWRAVAQGLRIIAPDVLAGVYTEEEIRSIQNDTPDPEVSPEECAQNDTPTQVPDKSDDLITEGQMKRLHVLMGETGLIPFKVMFKEYLTQFDGHGMDENSPSATQINKKFASDMIRNFHQFATQFFADSEQSRLVDEFATLPKKQRVDVIDKVKALIKDGATIKCSIKDETPDTVIRDWFVLVLSTLRNQLHNKVVDDGKKKGMSVDEVVDELEGLGMKPEVKETIDLSKPKKEDEMLNW